MPSHLKKLSQTLLSFAVAALFLYLAFRGTSVRDLWSSLQSVNYFWATLIIPIGLASHWVRAQRWNYLLSPIKQGISTRNLFAGVMIGYMVNNILPRVGELVRCYAVGRSEGISKSSALGTVVVERILDLLSFSLILCVVIAVSPAVLSPFVENVDAVRPIFLLGSIGAMVFFVFLFFKAETVFKLLNMMKPIIPKRFEDMFSRVVESFLSGFGIAKMRDKFIPIIGLSLVMWGLYISALYVTFFAFDDLVRLHLDFGAAVILITASTIAFILPAPGAMGTYHSFLSIVLVQLYGVDPVTALSYSIITHETNYIITTALGLYYFLKSQLKISEAEMEVGKTA